MRNVTAVERESDQCHDGDVTAPANGLLAYSAGLSNHRIYKSNGCILP